MFNSIAATKAPPPQPAPAAAAALPQPSTSNGVRNMAGLKPTGSTVTPKPPESKPTWVEQCNLRKVVPNSPIEQKRSADDDDDNDDAEEEEKKKKEA